ncbi:MAG: hypothetical protein ACHQZQ_07220 [SAR324 cluster bacterium]
MVLADPADDSARPGSLIPAGVGSVFPSGDLARLWALRRASVFDEQDPAVVRDVSELPQPAADLRLCAGPASLADWDRLAEWTLRLRTSSPEAVLRLELWADGGVTALPAPGAVKALRGARPVFIHVWIERSAELTPGVRSLLACCVDAGLPVGADIAVRRGQAATAAALSRLCLALLENRVRPYVLVDPAWLPDEERLAPKQAEALVRGMRGWISGLAVPQLVEESRTGVRAPRIPAYVLKLDEAGAEVVSYSGSRHRYPNPPRKPQRHE